MQSNNYFQSKMHLFGIFSVMLLLTSCGTYQYAGQNDDAIYGDSENNVEYTEEAKKSDNSDYYENYFKEKTEQYGNIAQDDDVIFTDIDSYEGAYSEETGQVEYTEGYAGWGQDNNDNVTINVYGGHLFNSIRWNRPWWGYGYYSVGWNRPWGWNPGWSLGLNWWNNPWGWNNWGWGYGYGGFYNSYWCPPYYNGYYGNGGYYGGYYNGRALAYNASRRGSSANSLASLSRRNSVNSNNSARRGSYNANANRRSSRPTARQSVNRRTRPNVNSNSRTRPNVNSRTRPTTRPRVRPNSNSRSKPRVNNNTRPTSRPSVRPSTTRRSNSSSIRSSSSNRSSGSRSSSSRSSSRRSGRM